MCRDGAVDKDLGKAFGVSVETISRWKRNYPEFLAALREGKDKADYKVECALYKRALGYEFAEVDELTGKDKDGKLSVRRRKITKHIPGEVVAMIFWLKNRKSKEWRDKHDVEGELNIVIKPAPKPDELNDESD